MNTKAKYLEHELMDNDKIIIHLGNNSYKVKRLTNWVSGKLSKLILKGELSLSDDKKQTLISFDNNRSLVPKCLSIAILGSWWKVLLFHWVYWRILNLKYSQSDYKDAILKVIDFSDIRFFFLNMASLQGLVEYEEKMTNQTTKSIIQNQKSDLPMT